MEDSNNRAKKESTIVPSSSNSPRQTEDIEDPDDPVKSPPLSANNSSTRKACYAVLQSWVSKKFMTGCVVLFPVAVTFFITWWFIQFVDGFFSPIYERLGIDIFGLGFITSLVFIFFVGIFASSWLGATVFLIGEWFIKRMPFVKHLYSASKQISSAISPDQNTTAFKEVAIIRHPRIGEYAFGFITSSVVLQKDDGDEELCSVYVPTNHLYIGDIFLVNSKEIIRPNLSIREGIGGYLPFTMCFIAEIFEKDVMECQLIALGFTFFSLAFLYSFSYKSRSDHCVRWNVNATGDFSLRKDYAPE
ncbi:Protein LIKE COV 2 [Forsythia ovata]|uniref:Protein LIKE COV 2 n=1 Tax=Forsythia ovata TaxID=205694 RepID=A0ABD1PZK6_9LAMI